MGETEDGLHAWMALDERHGHVRGQQVYLRVGISTPQGFDNRRRANHIADAAEPDDEDAAAAAAQQPPMTQLIPAKPQQQLRAIPSVVGEVPGFLDGPDDRSLECVHRAGLTQAPRPTEAAAS